MDTFFISYDEPQKEQNWQQIKSIIPSARRIDGVKGFNRAHKTCAALTQSQRLYTIDGDNQVFISTNELEIPHELLSSDYIFSWSSRNSINGLAYGNGGIKNWPTSILKNLQSHEDANDPASAIDFCFSLRYFQMPQTASMTVIHSSPEQAFRAGFREGIKMSLDRGKKIEAAPSQFKEIFHRRLYSGNMERLRIWCSVGADIENGLWAIYGARLGCLELYGNNLDLELIRDYDWFKTYWKDNIYDQTSSPQVLYQNINFVGEQLEDILDLRLVLLDAPASRFFKSTYTNRPRQGLMFPC